MRRFISITALVAAMFVSLSLEAQRGGMGGRGFGGGGHVSPGFRSSAPGGGRGFAGGGRGFAGGGRVFAPSGPRGFAPGGPRVFAPSRPFAPRTFSSSGFGVRTFAPSQRRFAPFPGRTAGFHRFHNNRFFFRNRFFFPGCFGCVSPFFFGGGFGGGLFLGDPFFPGYYPGFASDYSYGPPPQPVVVNTDNGGNAQLAMEVERLAGEVDDLRNDNLRYEESRNRYDSRAAAAPNTSVTVTEPVATVSFIFHDGRRLSARNYAIAGQTLWILDEHAAKKFALADLDVDATQQANAANGVDIHFPAPEKK